MRPNEPAQPANPQDMMGRLNEMRSNFNPTDAAMGSVEGGPGNMTVIELLQKSGIDPQGPATQLRDFFMKQMKNADPLNKMRGLAPPTGGMPPAGGMPQGQPPAQMPGGQRPQGDIGPQFDKLFR
jgi:hypothetical protein